MTMTIDEITERLEEQREALASLCADLDSLAAEMDETETERAEAQRDLREARMKRAELEAHAMLHNTPGNARELASVQAQIARLQNKLEELPKPGDEQDRLDELSAHKFFMEARIANTHAELGQAILSEVGDEVKAREEAVRAAQRALDEAKEAERAVRAKVGERLGDWPELQLSAERTYGPKREKPANWPTSEERIFIGFWEFGKALRDYGYTASPVFNGRNWLEDVAVSVDELDWIINQKRKGYHRVFNTVDSIESMMRAKGWLKE